MILVKTKNNILYHHFKNQHQQENPQFWDVMNSIGRIPGKFSSRPPNRVDFREWPLEYS